VSKEIIEWAKQAKFFVREAGEEAVPDDLLVRAAVAYGMLTRRYGGVDDPGPLMVLNADRAEEVYNRAYAIASIASNFMDHPPDTPERAELFSTVLDIKAARY